MESNTNTLECQNQFVSLRFETDDDDNYIFWRGDRMLRNLALSGMSAIVVGTPGSGRSVAVNSAEYGECKGDGYPHASGVDTFAGEGLEYLISQYLTSPEERFEPEWWWQKHIVANYSSGLCGFCSRHCLLSGVGRVYGFEDLFLQVAKRAEGRCPLRLKLGIRGVIKEKKPVIIDVNGDEVQIAAQMACDLLSSRIPVVLVASPQDARLLGRYPDIAALPVFSFPSMDDDVIAQIAQAKGCNDSRAVEMAQGNPRRLIMGLAMLSQTKEIELVGRELIPEEKVLQLEQPKQVDEIVEDYCKLNAGRAIKPTEVSQWLYQKYGLDASPEKVGIVLKKLGCKRKHTKTGNVYST